MRKILFLLVSTFIFSCHSGGVKETIVSKPIEVSDNELVNYIRYCNRRFDLCINYPSNFNPQPEPINGDGRTFIDEPDKAEITVYGAMVSDKSPLKLALKDLKSFLYITYLRDMDNGFEFYGINEKTRMIYRGMICIDKPENQDGVKMFHDLTFIYPVEKEAKFKDYWQIISQYFK